MSGITNYTLHAWSSAGGSASLTDGLWGEDLQVDGAAAGALPEQRRFQRLAAKRGHVPLYPGERHGLVLEAEVPGDHVVLGGQEASTEKKNGSCSG